MGSRHVLLVEDDGPLRAALGRELGRHFLVDRAASHDEALGILERVPDLFAVISDDDLGSGPRGDALLLRVAQAQPRCLRVLMSGPGGATHAEGTHLVRKPLGADELLQVLLGVR